MRRDVSPHTHLARRRVAESRPAPAPAPEPARARNLVPARRPPFRTRPRNVVRVVAVVVLLVAGFAATLVAAYNAEKLSDAQRVVTMALRGAALDASASAQVEQAAARMEEAPSFVLWEQRSSEYVLNAALGRSAKTHVVVAKGDVSLIVRGAHLPDEELPRPAEVAAVGGGAAEASDAAAAATGAHVPGAVSVDANKRQACIIDSATALELFGDVDVLGLSVRYGDEDFFVEAVVESARPLMLIRPTANTGVAFDMVSVHNTSAQPSKAFAERFTAALGLDVEVLDYGALYELAYLAAWLPTLLLAGAYLVYVLVQGFAKRNSMRTQAAYLLGFLAGLAALTAFVAFNVQLPRDMIPSRFSDFDLWRQIFDDAAGALAQVFDSSAYVPVAAFFDSFFAAVVLSAASSVLYVGALWVLTHRRLSAPVAATHYAPKPQRLQEIRPALSQQGKPVFSYPERQRRALRRSRYDSQGRHL